MIIEGNLKKLPFTELIRELKYTTQTGILYLEGEDIKISGEIYFEKGQVIQAISSLRKEPVGQELTKKTIENRRELREYLASRVTEISGEQKISDLLAQLDPIMSASIHEAIQLQTKEAFYDLLNIKEGIFRFIRVHFLEEILVRLDAEALLQEALNHHQEHIGISKALTQEIQPQENELNILNEIPLLQIMNRLVKHSGAYLGLIIDKAGMFHLHSGKSKKDLYAVSAILANIWGLIYAYSSSENNQIKDDLVQGYIKFKKHILFLRELDEHFLLILIGHQLNIDEIQILIARYGTDIVTQLLDFANY